MDTAKPFSVLFVCAANMCRSPTAHGIFRHKLRERGLEQQVSVDSAGTHNLHTDSPPDERSQQCAAQRAYDISDLRARYLQDADFTQADLILVMDWNNLSLVQQRCPPEHQTKVRRVMEFARLERVAIVPDPYRGEAKDFEHVLDLLEGACEGLIQHVRAVHESASCNGKL